MNDFEVIPAFATPIFVSTIPELTDEQRQYLMNVEFENDEIYSLSADKYILDRPLLETSKKSILDKVNTFATEILGIETKNEYDDIEFIIKNSWVLKTTRSNPYVEHLHARSIISGVLYINVDDNSGEINFRREYPNSTFTPYGFSVKHWNIYNSETYFVKPEIRKLILFPSTIKHFMGECNSDITRYSLAFDVYIKGIMGVNKTSKTFYNDGVTNDD